MTEEIPKQKNLNVKLIVIIGIVLLGLIIGGIVLFNNKKTEPTGIAVEALIDKTDATSITYSPQNYTSSNLRVGSTVQLAYAFNNGLDYKVEWTLSDNNIAKIENNKVLGLKPGNVKIQAIYKGKETIKSNFISLTFE